MLGAKVPDLKKLAGEFKEKVKGEFDFDDVMKFASRLWRGSYHEQRELALIILEKYRRHFDDDTWDILDKWIEDIDTWDLLDRISVELIGSMTVRDLNKIDMLMKWTESENFWRRRAAAASCVALVHGKYNHYPQALDVGRRLISDDHIMVQKAAAWLMREVSRKAPDDVFEMLRDMKESIPRFVLRESCKKLSDLQKMELLIK